MNVKRNESVLYKMRQRLKKIAGNVVLSSDFQDLAQTSQISRALKQLILEKKIVKIGFGIYAKAYESPYADVPLIQGSIDATLRQALNRLGVGWEPGSLEQAYNEGLSTQVPAANVVRLRTRCRRKIGYQKAQLVFEGKINAR